MALSLYPETDSETIGRVVQLVGVVGAALMISAMVVGAPWVVGWAAAALVIQYGLSLLARPVVDPWAPAYAALLFLTVESAYASLERRAKMAGLVGMLGREAGRLVVLSVAALAVAAVVLTLASIPVAHGILVQVAGVGAATTVLTSLVLLVRRRA